MEKMVSNTPAPMNHPIFDIFCGAADGEPEFLHLYREARSLNVVSAYRTRVDCVETSAAYSIPLRVGTNGCKIIGATLEVVSGLTHIEVTNNDPITLFKEWLEEARAFSTPMARAFCLATTSGCGKVSARYLLLGRLDDDGFVTMTNGCSPKSHDLSEVPSAAMCFHWAYKREKGEAVSRQVRIEGTVKKLGRAEYEDIYEKSDISYKIRDNICNQSSRVDWNELKATHDRMLENIKREGVVPPMPEHTAGYKLFPSSIEFYYAKDRLIADRVLFLKNPKASDWTHHHLAA